MSAIRSRKTGLRSDSSIASMPTRDTTGSFSPGAVIHGSSIATRSDSAPSARISEIGNACSKTFSAASMRSSCLPRKW